MGTVTQIRDLDSSSWHESEVFHEQKEAAERAGPDEEYAELLEIIPLPEVSNGKEKMKGLTYSDLAIILNHYKNLMNRFFRKKF